MELPIATLPWTDLGRKLESLCRKALHQFDLLEKDNKVLIALSGGKDSLTLLYLLKAISGRGFPDLDIRAVHVDGEFSCGASLGASFLLPICEQLQVPLTIRQSSKQWDGLACYGCSRERRKLIFDVAKGIGFHLVAFGHHSDDNIETLLMNLLHKAEFAGNLPKVPMYKYGVTIIRPLIYATEEQIRAFAKTYRFNRISCRCPIGQVSNRSKTKELIRQIEEIFPNVRKNLAQASFQFGSTKALNKDKNFF
jgi:tRNA 2-thiocytidine biosynthesis protein TtcA